MTTSSVWNFLCSYIIKSVWVRGESTGEKFNNGRWLAGRGERCKAAEREFPVVPKLRPPRNLVRAADGLDLDRCSGSLCSIAFEYVYILFLSFFCSVSLFLSTHPLRSGSTPTLYVRPSWSTAVHNHLSCLLRSFCSAAFSW